jgi:non-heme chloroperoxidase
MPTVTTRDGVEIYIRDEGSGPTVLFVPGWAVSTWWFREQFDALTDRFRVACYDPRGQGQSEKTTRGQRVARMAADLKEVIDSLGGDRVHLVAWSGGGSTALQYVELFGTERIATLTLVGAGPKLQNSPDWDLGFTDLQGAEAWRDLIRDDYESAARATIPQFFAEPLPQPQFDATLAEMLRCDAAAVSAASWDFLHQDYRDALPLVDVPTLVVAGAGDVSVPAGNAPFVHESIPGSQLVVIDGAAHCPFLEKPAEFNDALAKFITSH